MKKWWIFGGLALVLVLGSVYALFFFAANTQTTYFVPSRLGHGIGETIHPVPVTLTEQIQESGIIVRGRVVKILGTVETADARPGGPRLLHNNVVIEVEEYLGENKLSYSQIVVRLRGGQSGFYHHTVTPQEHFTVGEEVILLRLHQPSGLVQVPQGYVLEQYFVFISGSKLLSGPTGYTGERYPGQTFTLADIRRLIEEIQGN